jgi:hypothetical protein
MFKIQTSLFGSLGFVYWNLFEICHLLFGIFLLLPHNLHKDLP